MEPQTMVPLSLPVMPAPVGAERRAGLVRPRLVGAFQSLETPKRVGLVIAPAGHGKTTLLSHLAATYDHGPVYWITCERRDTAPAVFLERLAAVLADVLPAGTGPGEVIARLVAGAHPPLLLVVDDAYALGDGDAVALLGRLLGPEAPLVSVLVGSRVSLPVDLSRLRLGGGIVEYGAEDLRFRTWEVESLLRDIYREPLSPEDVAHLARKTQGWAACLQLFHLATRGKPAAERKAVLGTLNYRSRLVREFLTRNVLDQLPPALRDFLIQTSVLSRPTGALCDALLERHGSSLDLDELERRQLFTVRLDGEVGFRYHEVLRSYCLAELIEQVGEASVASRFVRAAELLEAAGDGEGAFVAYVSAGDRAGALRLLDQQGDALVGPATSLLDVLPPGWIDSDPWLSLAQARQLTAAGRFQEAADLYLRTAQAALPAAAASAERERRALTHWMAREPSSPADGSDWSALLRAALHADPAEAAAALSRLPGAAARLTEAVALALAGQLAPARLALAGVLSDPDASPLTAAAAHLLAAFDRVVVAAPADRTELVLVVDSVEAPALSRLAAAVAGAADEDGERAGAVAAQLAGAARRDSDRWGEAAVAALGALGSYRRGDKDAVPALGAAADGLVSLGAEVPATWLLVLAARHRLGTDPAVVARASTLARLARLPAAQEALERLTSPAAAASAPSAEIRAAAEPQAAAPAAGEPEAGAEMFVRCFGRFELDAADRPIDLGFLRPRTRALLLVLAFHGGAPVHRDKLCDALWPSADARAALRNLQVAISDLRLALLAGVGGEAGGVVRHGESYRLDLGSDIAYDVERFEQAVRRARAEKDADRRVALLREALALQAEPLLMAEGEVHWIVKRRDRLADAGAWAAAELSRLLLDRGDAPGAGAAAEHGLRLDRYRDELWRRLVQAAEQAGDAAEAARSRQRYQEVLSELGLSTAGARSAAG